MSEGGFFEQKRSSPTSLAIVIILHGVALTALALSKMEVPVIFKSPPIIVDFIKNPKDPAPIPPEKAEKQQQPSVISATRPVIPADLGRTIDFPVGDDVVIIPGPGPIGDGFGLGEPFVPPRPAPVRIEAKLDSNSELLPPYPSSEQRAGREGSVTIRVLIGTDGRVKEAQMVRADSEAFYRATERQALRNWRFEPARIDGRPVESRKSLTVHFQLT